MQNAKCLMHGGCFTMHLGESSKRGANCAGRTALSVMHSTPGISLQASRGR